MEGIEVPLHDKKLLVWCGISEKKIYGPYYFEGSVNQHNYLKCLKWFYAKHYLLKDNQYYFSRWCHFSYGRYGIKLVDL